MFQEVLYWCLVSACSSWYVLYLFVVRFSFGLLSTCVTTGWIFEISLCENSINQSINTASNWIKSFILNILDKNLFEFQKPWHRYGLHFSAQIQFIYTMYILYIVLFSPYMHFYASLYRPRRSLLKVHGEMLSLIHI